ncbi:MAG: hypothetical protein J7L25_08000 [Deltaproteobacteria bacterium]|nr:hypothetical protein [Candidatus Tharpella aukensis]
MCNELNLDGVVKSSDILRCCGSPDTRHTTCMVSRLENHNILSIEIFT